MILGSFRFSPEFTATLTPFYNSLHVPYKAINDSVLIKLRKYFYFLGSIYNFTVRIRDNNFKTICANAIRLVSSIWIFNSSN